MRAGGGGIAGPGVADHLALVQIRHSAEETIEKTPELRLQAEGFECRRADQFHQPFSRVTWFRLRIGNALDRIGAGRQQAGRAELTEEVATIIQDLVAWQQALQPQIPVFFIARR